MKLYKMIEIYLIYDNMHRIRTINAFICINNHVNSCINSMLSDIQFAFLNGELEEEVYWKQPDGYVKKGREHLVMRLKNDLYGLKQAPRAWCSKLDERLSSLDFTRSFQDHAVYFKRLGTSHLIIGVYVDDLIIIGTKNNQIEDFKAQMKNNFEMSDLRLLTSYMGIEVTQESGKILLSQRRYALMILEQSGMS